MADPSWSETMYRIRCRGVAEAVIQATHAQTVKELCETLEFASEMLAKLAKAGSDDGALSEVANAVDLIRE